jgi:hypothetical protein
VNDTIVARDPEPGALGGAMVAVAIEDARDLVGDPVAHRWPTPRVIS